MPEMNRKIDFTEKRWIDKISNHAQVGGIETSVLDNGHARGTRIAWINTGTGLRYKIVLDRAMDIAEAFYNQHSLAWISHAGISAPQPFSNKAADWLRTFGGGLVTTCGLSHVGGPESDEFGERGLHGNISNTPAEIISIVQPDPAAGQLEMSITGVMKEMMVFDTCFELKRTISGKLGESFIQIHDEITNRSNTPAPHMILYHINFGWPLVDEGTDLIWKGDYNLLNPERDAKIFNENNNYKKCPAPMEAHRGKQEAVAYMDAPADEIGNCLCGLYNATLGLALSIQFKKEQLPWLTNWQHWGPNEYVTALEPGTNPPIGQARARKQNALVFIAPGQKKTYDLKLQVMDEQTDISNFLFNNK